MITDMQELLEKTLDQLDDDSATIGFKKEGDEYVMVFFSDDRESFPREGNNTLKLLQSFAEHEALDFSDTKEYSLTAAEKRIYLNAFSQACLVAGMDTPARAAYKAVMFFRGEPAELHPKYAVEMWEYMRTCALGL